MRTNSGSEESGVVSGVEVGVALESRSATTLSLPGVNWVVKLYACSLSDQRYRRSGLCPDPPVSNRAVRAWWSVRNVKCRPYRYMCHLSHAQMQASASLLLSTSGQLE